MKLAKATCLILMMVPFLGAVEKPYANGTIVDVQQKTNTRVLYYLVNTPVTQDDPYYEISVRLKDTVYFGRYTPIHSSDTLPEDWHAGSVVSARIDGRNLVVRRPGGSEVSFAFTRRPVVKIVPSVSADVPASK